MPALSAGDTAWALCHPGSWHAATTILAAPVILNPRKHPECFRSFLCTSPASTATGASLHIRGTGLSTALCATQEGCPRHPSTSSPEAGSYRASTYLRQHSTGDIHHFPSVFLQDSTALGRRQVPMAVLLGEPSFPSPPQAGLWLTSATACCCHKPAPGSVSPLLHLFSPISSARTHRNHVCLTIYKTSPSCCFTMGSVQLGPGPHTGISLELVPAFKCQEAVSAGSRCRGSCSLEAMQEQFRLTLTSTPGPWLVVRVDSGRWKVAGHRTAQLQFHRQREGSSRATSKARGHRCAAGARQFFPQWPALPVHLCCPNHDKGRGRLS